MLCCEEGGGLALKPVFEFKITPFVCWLVLRIHKGYFVAEKLVLDVGIKAF